MIVEWGTSWWGMKNKQKDRSSFLICLCILHFDFVKSTSTLSMARPGLLDIGVSPCHVTCALLAQASLSTFDSADRGFLLIM